MERHFERSLEDLVNAARNMGGDVLRSLDAAILALVEREPSHGNLVFEIEKSIDADEILLDEKILDFIALHQPVASDLRFVLALQDAVIGLERIGDHCTNIAQSSISLSMLRTAPDLGSIPEMLPLAKKMVKDSLDAFLARNPHLARTTIAIDDRVDELNRTVAREVIRAVKEDRQLVETGLDIIRIAKNLERICDLSANIAEDALFAVEGKPSRHQAQG